MNITPQLRKNIQFYFLLALIVLFGALSLLVVWPFVGYMIVATVLVFVTYPLYIRLKDRLQRPNIAALLLLLFIIIALFVPLTVVSGVLVREANDFVRTATVSAGGEELGRIEENIEAIIGGNLEIRNTLVRTATAFGGFLTENVAAFVGAIANFFIGMFVMVFLMYYLYKEGPNIVDGVKHVLPMHIDQKEHLLQEVDSTLKGVLIGHLLTALIQGLAGAVGFFIFGIENAVLWGFLMIILSVIPMLGPFVIYLPISISLLFGGEILKGILLLIYGVGFVGTIDNLIRPYLTSRYTDIHPAVVLIGVLGGLNVMGIVGLILGPLFIGIFIALIRTYQASVSAKIEK